MVAFLSFFLSNYRQSFLVSPTTTCIYFARCTNEKAKREYIIHGLGGTPRIRSGVSKVGKRGREKDRDAPMSGVNVSWRRRCRSLCTRTALRYEYKYASPSPISSLLSLSPSPSCVDTLYELHRWYVDGPRDRGLAFFSRRVDNQTIFLLRSTIFPPPHPLFLFLHSQNDSSMKRICANFLKA